MVAQQLGTGGVGETCGRQTEHCDSVWQLHRPGENWNSAGHNPEPVHSCGSTRTLSEQQSNQPQPFNSHPGIFKKGI